MTIFIYVFTLFMNAVFAFRKKQSNFLAVFTLVVICLLMSGAGPEYISYSDTLDYENYQRAYERINQNNYSVDYEIGFVLLMKIGNLLHLNFFIFRLIVIAVCLTLIYKKVIRRYAYNSNYVLMLYMIFPMIIDSEQWRNFIALTILLIAVRFLENKNAKNNIKFIAMIFLAASFHIVSLLYLFLIFVNSKNKNDLIKIIVLFASIVTVFIIINHNQVPFLGVMNSLFEDERTLNYLGARTKLGYLIPIFLQLISIMLVYLSKVIVIRKNEIPGLKLITNKNLKIHTPLNDVEVVNLIFWINVIAIIYFPLFTMSIQFYRLIRNFLLLNIIAYSLASYKLRPGSANKFGFNLLVIGNLLLWLYMNLTIIAKVDRVLIPFFTQNVF